MDQYNKKKFTRYIKPENKVPITNKENAIEKYLDNKRNCVGCSKNTLAKNTFVDPPAPINCLPLLEKIESEILPILLNIGLIPVDYNPEDGYIFVQAPNGLVLNVNRLSSAAEKFKNSLPEGGVEAFVQKFITNIFIATAQATESLFITIFVSIILQSFILYLIILFIFWINKITTTGITLIWAFIGFIIAAAAFTVMAVEASRQSIIISNTVDQQLTEAGTSVGSITCALSSALTCYFDGVDCQCKNASSPTPCGSTGPFIQQNTTSINIEKYSGTPGKFFFTYSGPLDENRVNLNVVNGVAVVETTGESPDAFGLVVINGLANGEYIVNEIYQLGWKPAALNPVVPDDNITLSGTITFRNEPSS